MVYATQSSAQRAIDDYNGVALDGQKMRIEMAARDSGVVRTLSSGIKVTRSSQGGRGGRGGRGGGRPQSRVDRSGGADWMQE